MKKDVRSLIEGAAAIVGFALVGCIGLAVLTAYVKVGYYIVTYVWQQL